MGWSIKNVSVSKPMGNLGGTAGAVGGAIGNGAISDKWDEITGTADRQKAADNLKKVGETADAAYDQTTTENQKLNDLGQSYSDANANLNSQMNSDVKAATDPYVSSLQNNLKEAEDQATDGRKTYSQSIEPTLKSNMEESMRNAQGAMSLEESGDANNALQTQIRNEYDNQAAGTMNQGAASSGILQALGNQESNQQANATTGPMMSGGALQANMQANQGAAGNAMAGGMSRASDLQNQGITLAQQMNDSYYQAGQDAQAKAATNIGDYQNADLAQQGLYQNQQGEQQAIGGESAGTQGGVVQGMQQRANDTADTNENVTQSQAERDIAALNQKYGTSIGALANQAKTSSAASGGILGTAGGILGKIFGG